MYAYLASLLLFIAPLFAQSQEGRFRIGMGAHYISNNYTQDHLYDFGALSLNTSYTLLSEDRFSVVWEQQILLRQKENGGSRRSAFIASAPLLFRYQPRRKAYYLGLGPSYLNHQYQDYAQQQKVSGLQIHALAGLVFRKKEEATLLLPETHLRAGIFKDLRSGNMAPHLSLLFHIGFKKEGPANG
ncbi:hypothetical protein SAMN05444008_10752 [Cnuella takakiae]|uniref:Outer membrane protein beta-barrel domain-containing protein n=1 Tax=Cnuella takakiae TaxID=1302690 RepID=A0A1M5AXZ7_9BACT|nr:hypothetical protein [Cnuella takakiae]OLY93265.1 hypothetical protein BUE76_16250 [Cnuella takakiae]SHF35095.1 hypothetical protein SAMN05444008_10752 [Cnuella takakiae]